jgi:hypothetical protein
MLRSGLPITDGEIEEWKFAVFARNNPRNLMAGNPTKTCRKWKKNEILQVRDRVGSRSRITNACNAQPNLPTAMIKTILVGRSGEVRKQQGTMSTQLVLLPDFQG